MPFLHIRICGPKLTASTIETLQREATALMAGVMRKRADLTAVLVEEQDHGRWSIGGRPVTVAAHLDVKVTAGTNTAQETSEFIRRAHALLAGALGADLPLATYVVVDEVPADAWGYGGLTQEARRVGGV